ncbi:MAG TPA: VCBS repeat-containing protein, partial [Vicinamibacterales bacterium]
MMFSLNDARKKIVVRTAAMLSLALLCTVLRAQGDRPTFSDVADRAGLAFTHYTGATGDKWYPELFGGGVAVLDIDGDRWPDLLFVNGKDWRAGGRPARHGLFRNNHDGTFKDVLAGSGFDTANVYGIGASVADYDNDGR